MIQDLASEAVKLSSNYKEPTGEEQNVSSLQGEQKGGADGQQAGAQDSSEELIEQVAKDSNLQEEITTQGKTREAVILSSN